ncbi:MAG: hypothetical protein ACREMY_06090 [bacterium]
MDAPTRATKIRLHIPDDSDWLQAVARVAITHSHLDHILRLTIKTLAGVTGTEALDATERDGSTRLRDRIRKLARRKLGEGQPLVKLQAILRRCARVTLQRNKLMHNIVTRGEDGEPRQKTDDHELKPLPSLLDLGTLLVDITNLVGELDYARKKGFLREALRKREKET